MRKSLLVLLLLSLSAGCLSRPVELAARVHPWAGALRALDPADTSDPAHDLTAVYVQQVDDELHIRVDLLDFQNAKELSLDIKIGDDSSPGTPSFNIHVPSEENIARIALDPLLATVTVDIPLAEVPSRPRVDVSTPGDGISGLTLDGPVPTRAASLLLTFFDTFAGRFPAEALRRWDGAHTGPRGERHGLKHLLDAVDEHQIPIVLLDLKEPENLSVLDALGVLPHIQQMEQAGLLLLPEPSGQEALFGLSPSPFTWGEIKPRPTFVFTNDPSHIYQPLFSQTTYIPIALETDSTQPTANGPSLEVRRALLEVALNADEKDILVVGGSLRNTTWASPDMVSATLAYFASRPYIHILTAGELIDFPAQPGKPEIRPAPRDEALEKLTIHYQSLTEPVLKFVENWQGSPLSGCAANLYHDDRRECVLAKGEFLAILDPQGGRLTYLFSVTRIGDSRYVHQLIGPSWQVAVGLSNPSQWGISGGEAADPGAYPGAFADADDPFKPYEPASAGDTILFTSLDGTRTKTYTLTDTGIEVKYQTSEPVTTQIPLLVDPATRFAPGWAGKYIQQKAPDGVAWGLGNGPMVKIQFDGEIELRAFNESLSVLNLPEDPDFDYPPGHTIPFPMAIAEVQMQDGYFLRLVRLP